MIGSIQAQDVEFTVNGVPIKFKLKKQTYPEGTGYFNWGELDDAEKKVANGHIRGDINFVFQSSKDTTGYYNNGYYLSVNPADSQYFGGFGIRLDMKIQGGAPFLDLGDIFKDEEELKKFFIARGDYSEDNDELVEIYKNQEREKLEKKKNEKVITTEEFNTKITELEQKKYNAKEIVGIKESLWKGARNVAVCNVIDALGHEKLRELGVVGVMDSRNRPNWVCLESDKMDHSVRFMNSSDYKIPSVDKDWTKDKISLGTIFAIDTKIPLDSTVLGKIHYYLKDSSHHDLKDSLYKEPMTAKDIDFLLDEFTRGLSEKSIWDTHAGLYLNPAEKMDNNQQNRAQKNAPPYIKTPLQEDLYKVIAKFMKENPTYKMPSKLEPSFKRLEDMHNFGLELSEQELRTHFLRNGPSNDPFLKQLMYGLNFIDANDYLRKMAMGDGAPWAAYDPWGAPGHNLGKWQLAMKVPYMASKGKMNPTDGIKEVFKIFREDSEIKFRGHAVTAGGPFDKEGKLMTGDTSEGQGYFRITAEQLAALRNHKFIKNIDAIKVDPSVEGAEYIVRYDYPDARDYEKLKDLAPEFYKAIQAEIKVKGKDEVDQLLGQVLPSTRAGEIANNKKDPHDLANIDPQHHFSVKFTSMLIGELFKKLDDKTISPEERYQLMLTLHPFFDTNGRCARAFYQLETGKPFMFKNWDFDILYTPSQLKNEIDKGVSDWVRFVGEWKKESTAAYSAQPPRAPSFYTQPQMWLRQAGIDPNQYNLDEQKHIMYKLHEIFKSDDFYKFQEKKAWFDTQALVKQELKPTLDQIQTNREEMRNKEIAEQYKDAKVKVKNAPKAKELDEKYIQPQKDKGKKLGEEIGALKGTEKEAKVKGVVIEEPSAGLKKLQALLQDPEKSKKRDKKMKELDHKANLSWRKEHALAKEKLDPTLGAKNLSDVMVKKGKKYAMEQEKRAEEQKKDEIQTLVVTMRHVLVAQNAIAVNKIKENQDSNPFSRTFINLFYSSYVNDLQASKAFLDTSSDLVEKYLEKLKDKDNTFKDAAEAQRELKNLYETINSNYENLHVNEKDVGTQVKDALDMMNSKLIQISELKVGLDKKSNILDKKLNR